MPARSKSQQRLFGMVHAYQKGKLKNAPKEVKEIARSISDEDAEHFAKTKHDGLPEKKADDIESMARRHYPEEGSHGWNHIQDVLDNARHMRRRELLRKELAAIMYHDSSLMTGDRETHADDSAEIARKDLSGLFSRRQLEDIANAIAHHRASYEGKRSSRLEDLVAAADRPVPDLAKQVARSWKYHEELGEPEGMRAENVASHLKEKYGHGGYAYGNAPRLYMRTYGRELRDIMSKFDDLTPETVASMMSGMPEKKASAKIDIPAIYDEIRRAYADMGYPVSGDRLVVSEQPTYVDGRPVPADVINPNGSGGNTQNDGTVRINPRYRAVMRHWGLKGSGRDFLRKIIGHEIGHHIDMTVLGDRPADRRRLLQEIAKAKFHTVYTDSYGPDTDPRKLDKELLAEYLAHMVKRNLDKNAEDTASMSRDRIQAQYARHPQESLSRLAARLAKNKWGPEDVEREYESHSREYERTKEDKEFLDRYIIARIAEAYDKKASAKQALMRILWEKEHNGESFDAALPYRMARFRQYEGIPFGKKAEVKPSVDDLLRMYDVIQADARLGERLEGLGFGRGGDAYRRAAVKMHVMELAHALKHAKRVRNLIAHRPGYVPSRYDADRAIRQYEDADAAISEAVKR